MKVINSGYIALNDKIYYERWSERNLEGTICGQIKLLSQQLSGGTDKKNMKHLSPLITNHINNTPCYRFSFTTFHLRWTLHTSQ